MRPLPVVGAPTTRGQAVRGRLAQQRVPERVAAAVRPDEHAGRHRLREGGVERVVGQSRRPEQQVVVHRLPSDGRHLDECPGGLGQPREPVPEEVARERGAGGTGRDPGSHELLDEEGQPRGPLCRLLDDGSLRHRSGQRLEVLGHLLPGEPSRTDQGDLRQARQLRDPLTDQVERRVRGPDGHHHQQLLVAGRPDEVVEEVQAGLVGPVHVLEHDRRAAMPRGVEQPGGHRGQDLPSGHDGLVGDAERRVRLQRLHDSGPGLERELSSRPR